ncbi:flavin-dependent oxidoreductase [Nitratireductor mangrovi]|uniref:Flavin-dependent oxidoreductase n=1 Tax=Nitratireductor mangrovi TaxID=2599600 RepID=A0A5B8KW94_9HYPH|nr:flavin-dependent oxidoreductase [Nitratireductor mangrovi]QDY99845.1 flavin-dependent oxidoreductase [Nitratireductor mangrovi]
MKHALVIGGGIGGLAAALALHANGIRATVFEAVAALRPLGVGINLLPHGARVLYGLGLGDALDRSGIRTRAIEYRTRYGHLIASDPRGIEAGFEHPQYSIHRGHLQMLLLDAVRERLGEEAVQTGMRLETFEQTCGGVTARFRTPSGETIKVGGDLLVGADGFHSRVRSILHPDEGPAHAEGMMMFRGAVEREPFGDGRTMFIAGNHDVKFVCYPISEKARRRGRSLVNWVAEVRHDRPRPATEAGWADRGDRDFISAFSEFRMPDIDIVELMSSTETVLEYPMIDRDPLGHWGRGRATLLGDAAHPMYPIGANGASQAIIDAGALAAHLGEAVSVDEGLATYEADRLPRTSGVVLANRQAGPEQVLDIADARLTGPDDALEDLIAPHEVEAVASRYRQVAGFTRRAE